LHERAQQQTVDQVNDEIRALERPAVGWPIVGVQKKCQQRQWPSGRTSMTTENEGAKRVRVRHTPHFTERADIAEIVEEKRSAEPGPVSQYGDADSDNPA
jgi:hypothetical protein